MRITRLFPFRSFRRGNGRGGNAMVEFSLVFITFLTMVVAMFEFVWVLFLRSTLHNAVREGVRYAITANPGQNGLDPAIKLAMKDASGGILTQAELDAHVRVEFFDPTCANGATCPAGGAGSAAAAPAEAGSVVKVSIECYDVSPITNLVRPMNPSGTGVSPFSLTVSASDKVEPFPGAPPSRGALAAPTACP